MIKRKSKHEFPTLLKFAEYLLFTFLFLVWPNDVPLAILLGLGVHVLYKFVQWILGGSKHSLVRFALVLGAMLMLVLELPLQYYLAAILFVWADALLRFSRSFAQISGTNEKP